MKLSPYPEYKDSDVPWLGRIPAHWELHRGKWLFQKMERAVRPQDDVVTCFRDGTVTLRKNRRTRGFTESLKEIGYQGIRKGDLVIHQMDSFAGAVGVSDSDGKGTPVYSVCIPKRELCTYYYAQLVREMSRSDYITSLAKGIRERSTDFRFHTFASLALPVPVPEEQRKMSEFIKKQTAQINKFIRNKLRLIALLKEQKQTIINDAVTGKCEIRKVKGEDGEERLQAFPTPPSKLRPSGVEWIGDISEHWEVTKLKQVVVFNPSKSETGLRRTSETKVVFLPMENISVNGDVDCSVKRSLSEVWDGFTYFQRGDVVLAKITPCFENSKGAYLKELESDFGFGTTELIVLRPSKIINGAFLRFLTSTYQFLFLGKQHMAGAAGQQRIPSGFVKNYPFALPSVDEQLGIIEYISKKSSAIDQTITRAEREIELIREYRTRLISDVVTGQVDVRDVEVPEVAEDELAAFEAEMTEDDLSEDDVEQDDEGSEG